MWSVKSAVKQSKWTSAPTDAVISTFGYAGIFQGYAEPEFSVFHIRVTSVI